MAAKFGCHNRSAGQFLGRTFSAVTVPSFHMMFGLGLAMLVLLLREAIHFQK